MSKNDVGRTSTEIQEDVQTLIERMRRLCSVFSKREEELEELANLQGNLKGTLKAKPDNKTLKEESDRVLKLIQDLAPFIGGFEQELSEIFNAVKGLEGDLKEEGNELEEIIYEF